MAGDNGESCIITKDVERMLEFSMAQVDSTGGNWASAFLLEPNSRGWATRSRYSRSKELHYVLYETVTEGSLKRAGISSRHQGAEQIQWSLTLGPSESQHLDATTQRTLKTFPSSPSVSAPKTAIAERVLEEGRGRKQRAHQVLWA